MSMSKAIEEFLPSIRLEPALVFSCYGVHGASANDPLHRLAACLRF
jgi:hypothetical protein